MSNDTGTGENGAMPELVHPAQLDPRLAGLTRPQSTGFTGGLCRALAERWQVDPIIVRLVMLALTFAGGVGIALYAWGCLLTPRVSNTPPILRWLPAFGTWPKNTQLIIIAVSSLVLVLTVARQTGVGWGPVIVVGALAWAMARRRRNSADSPDATPTDTSFTSVPRSARSSSESVEQWRARLSPHADSPLPAVDLYAPEASRQSTAPPTQRSRRNNWWAAAAILLLMAVAAVVPVILGLTPAVLWAGVLASGTAAVLILLHALIMRSHQLPVVLLLLVLSGAVGVGLLAANQAPAVGGPSPVVPGEEHSYTFFGEAPAELDLTGLQLDAPTTVSIDATASVVQIRVDDPPGNIEVNSDTILMETSYSNRSQSASDLRIIIDGDFSVVDIETVP